MNQKYASLKLAVNHNELKLVKNIIATEKTIHGLVVNFDFRTPEWSELTKTASFIRDGVSYLVLLDNVDECFIPWECLESEGTFTIGVFGVSDGVRLTTNVLRFNVAASCVCEGQEPAEPTQSVYEEILALCGDANRMVQSIRDDVESGRLNGKDGTNGITPHISMDGYWYIGEQNTNIKAQGSDGVGIKTIMINNGNLQITLTNQVTFDLGNISGEKGEVGYTPQRGLDYWTTKDQAEIQDYINQQLGVIENGSY